MNTGLLIGLQNTRSLVLSRVEHLLILNMAGTYECVSKSFRTGRLELELQMIKLSATRCSFIVSL